MSKSKIDSWRQPISNSVVAAMFVLLVLNLVDAFVALYGSYFYGAEEVNPFRNKFLDWSPLSFLAVKYLLVALSGIMLVFCAQQKRLARDVLVISALWYLTIVIHELIMLRGIS